MKRGIIIGIAVAVVALIGTAIYFFTRTIGDGQPGIVQREENVIRDVLSGLVKTPRVIANDLVFDYWLNKKTSEIYYLSENGEVKKIDADGKTESTGSRATGNLSYIKPSSTGNLILVAFGYPKISFAIHNLANKSWQAMPAGTTAAAWDPRSDNRIVYLRESGEVSRLNLLTLSDGRSQELLRFAQKDLEIDWAIADLVYLKERPSAQVVSSLRSYDLKTGIIKTVIADEPALMVKWGPNGAGLKWAVGLSIIDGNNRTMAESNLITIPTKCAFSTENKIYCAAPGGQSPTATVNLSLTAFPDNYLKKEVLSQDSIYVVSPEGFTTFFNAELQKENLDVEHMEVVGNQLIFLNRLDKKLYSLGL